MQNRCMQNAAKIAVLISLPFIFSGRARKITQCGSITIEERTASKVKGTYTAIDYDIQFTGEFDVPITDEDCQNTLQ